jgi:hypothetical protein
VASVSLCASVEGDNVPVMEMELIVLGNLGWGDAEECKVVYPFGDGADPFRSEDVSASICEVAVDARQG